MTENQRRYQKARAAYIERSKKWHKANPERSRALKKKWKAANKDKVKLVAAKARWKRAGIVLDHEQYNEILMAQGGVCAICSGVERRKLAADHDHETGRVRGLICTRCNVGLGYYEHFANNSLLDIVKRYLNH